ncbi:MAG: hypothetical protein CMJ78_03525 [Planctomycetaceae bacterium]|nr:hypothetical protein [Planctomycetaceae bacterium]
MSGVLAFLHYPCFVVAVAAISYWQPHWLEKIRALSMGPASISSRALADPAELLAQVDNRLSIEREQLAKLEEPLVQTENLKESLLNQVSGLEARLRERRIELERYAEFVNRDEGVILTDGRYVPASEVRERAYRKRDEYSRLQRHIGSLRDMVDGIARSGESIALDVKRRTQAIDELQVLRDGREQKSKLLDKLESNTQRDAVAPLSEVENSVESLMDLIDVRLEILSEKLTITTF